MFTKSQKGQVEIGVDIGGSSTKISVRKSGSQQLTDPIKFCNKYLFQIKKEAGKRITESIMSVIEHYQPNSIISLAAISMTGKIDHIDNVIVRSDRLNQLQTTEGGYGGYDLPYQIANTLQQMLSMTTRVVLLHDSISACVDPLSTQRLVLTLTLGTYPVLGLSQKGQNSVQIYDRFIRRWTFDLVLSTGDNITLSLNSAAMKERDDLTNCKIVIEAIIQILNHYREVFSWQPDCFIILGGNAHVLKHRKQWPEEIGHVNMVAQLNHDQSVKRQMRGALHYAKNKQKFKID